MKSQEGLMYDRKVFVAMSGGVDSSVAALLLKEQGYDCVGVFMKCWSGDASLGKLGMNCAWERDSEDARRVAKKLGIPFYVWDFEAEYKQKVVDYMVEGYRHGITPNPDVMCNREIKFGLFLEKALSLGADYIATGHYVRLRTKDRGQRTENAVKSSLSYVICSARDEQKDQSYFLWTLTQAQLSRCLFPIGDYKKSEVRIIARKAGLPTAEKKDSQGICFLGKITIADFLKQYIPEHEGAVMALNGERIGTHKGAEFYTIGQRRIGSAMRHSLQKGGRKPFYIAKKDIKKNTVTLVCGNDDALYCRKVVLQDVNFIDNIEKSQFQIPVRARVRYRQPLQDAILSMTNGGLSIVFSVPQRAVASGQSAVFYSDDGLLLGGGIIC